MTLEEQFALLVADGAIKSVPVLPELGTRQPSGSGRTRTVYSVGEAISHRGRTSNAKLGAGSL